MGGNLRTCKIKPEMTNDMQNVAHLLLHSKTGKLLLQRMYTM